MEWEIGEIRQINGEWHQCVKSDGTCNGCVGKFQYYSLCNEFDECVGKIFKKLEKVGEPYELDGYLFQSYHTFEVPIFTENYATVREYGNNSKISIEIKQNKEDMEGKTNLYEKQTPLQKLMEIYCDGRMDYNEFEKKVKELYSDKGDDSKPILKPFDLEAAKAGKPVCTRDGRKARIICFDRNDLYPIVALIECEDGKEIIGAYSKEGQTDIYEIKGTNLMMTPEKKEGWVNIVRGSNGKSHMGRGIFQSKEEAEYAIKAFSDNLIDTIKVSWEE